MRYLLTLSLAFSLAALSSCSKSYTCVCTYTMPSAGLVQAMGVEIKGDGFPIGQRDRAAQECKEQSMVQDMGGSQFYMICELR